MQLHSRRLCTRRFLACGLPKPVSLASLLDLRWPSQRRSATDAEMTSDCCLMETTCQLTLRSSPQRPADRSRSPTVERLPSCGKRVGSAGARVGLCNRPDIYIGICHVIMAQSNRAWLTKMGNALQRHSARGVDEAAVRTWSPKCTSKLEAIQ
jgi:hypothetical protein